MDDDEMEGRSGEECDPDYEFDAARFYDFRRSETCSEAEAAERWFESAGTYPPSRKHRIVHRRLLLFFFFRSDSFLIRLSTILSALVRDCSTECVVDLSKSLKCLETAIISCV